MAREFWKSAGLHLLTPNAAGWLTVTPDFLRAYWTRPEVHPVDQSAEAEIRLHEALLDDPARAVSAAEIAALADPDAIETYRIVLSFRDLLLQAGTLEAAYLKLARGGRTAALVPPVFLDQLVHVILRHALRDCVDPMRLKAAELLFREQTVALEDGRVMLADEEVVEMQAQSGAGGLAQLIVEAGVPPRSVALDVLRPENADIYWARSDRFDTVIDFRVQQPAMDAFARVIETWFAHFFGLETRVEPRPAIEDRDWRWHIGLDAEATRLMNALYAGETLPLEDAMRILGLFRVHVAEPQRLIDRVRGKPIYLGMAMTAGKRLRLKPQNLLANMPLVETH